MPRLGWRHRGHPGRQGGVGGVTGGGSPTLVLMAEATWREIAAGVWVRRHVELELNLGLVVGKRRALVIDTHSSGQHGREVLASIREITDLELVVVNTHAHYDHCFGNEAFRDSQIYAHAGAAEDLSRTAEHQRQQVVNGLRQRGRDEVAQAVTDTEIVVPFYLIETDTPIDLGERTVDLLYAGRGHTDHDVVVAVPDVGVVFWGDLIEQGADPAMEDGFPLEWPVTLEELLARGQVQSAAHHVPGHGDVVGVDMVLAQQEQLAGLASRLAEALAEGVGDVQMLTAKSRGLGLQDATLRMAAVRALETRS